MKPLLSLFIAGLGLMLVIMIGLPLANAFVERPGAHPFQHLNDPPLWTSEPVRIDRMAQAYPREDTVLPDLDTAVASNEAGQFAAPTTRVASDAGAATELASATSATGGLPDAHVAWCAARYRSYQPEDNTYQPFSGPRRNCVSPDETPSNSVAAVDEEQSADRVEASMPASATTDATLRDHVAWCGARYSSYRPEDNTYQPFSGPRRICQSPFAGDTAARDDVKTSDLHSQQAQM